MTPLIATETMAADLARIDTAFDKQRDNREAIALTTAAQRIDKLKRLLAWVQDHRDEIVAAAAADFGKPEAEALLSEVYPVTSEAKHTIRHLKRWMKRKRVGRTLALASTKAYIRYEPRGVALIIAPWNYPFCLCVGPLISAIAAGNAVCIKPSVRCCSAIGANTNPITKGAVGIFSRSKVKPIKPKASMTHTSNIRLPIANEPITQQVRIAGNK